jgi:hypothetical protein
MNDAQLVIDIWDTVRDNVTASKRTEVAIGIMRAVLEYGMEANEIASVADEDKDLEEAFFEVYYDGEHPEEEEEEM